MLPSLRRKLTLAFLLVALTVALLVAVSLRAFSAGSLDRLIVEQQRGELQSALATYYEATGSWEGVASSLGRSAPPPNNRRELEAGADWEGPEHAPRRNRRELFGVVDVSGTVVVPLLPDYPLGARVPAEVLAQGQPILVDGQRVGTILTATEAPGLNPEEAAYLQRTTVALLVASAGAVLVALLVGMPLAGTLTRPLRALTEAAHRMAGGELEQAVPVKSSDEIGELAAAFNRMSREIARAHQARKQMTADVAHELRTPLTVIAGHIEAMRDGVLPATPERLSVIYAEIEQLQHLVGDLRTLTQADAGELKLNLTPLPPGELLDQARATFEPQAGQKGVALEIQVEARLPAVRVDEIRMTQVLENLISNALRYTPAGGRITLSAAAQGDQVRLSVEDTGPGIPPEHLPHVFDRFYRADESRSGDDGESGLGLAIAKAIVEAHGGALTAENRTGGGARFSLTLPARGRPAAGLDAQRSPGE